MAKKLLDFDLTSGLSYYTEEKDEQQIMVGSYQDCEPLIDHCKRVANEGLKDQGIKEGWWHYASYPAIIIEKWMNEYGVNVFDKDHKKKVLELTNRPEYRYLKTTTKMHRG